IIDQIRSLDWAPRSLRAIARKIGASREKLRHEKGREPTSADIAEDIGTTAEHVDDVMAQLQTAQILCLDDYLPSEDNAEARKIDVTSDREAPSPIKAAEKRERQEMLFQAILKLPDQQQKVLN